jgi:oligoribonuclease
VTTPAELRENWLLWLDLETSGSDVDKDCIIEVGCVLTTWDLEEMGEFQSLVAPTPEGLGRMMMNDVVRNMHEKNGLLQELLDTGAAKLAPIHKVTSFLLEWLKVHGIPEKSLILAGAGVGHFDKRFIDKYMPQLSNYMKYWVIDISVARRAYELWTGKRILEEEEDKAHRALDDVRYCLKEARAFKDVLTA